MKLWTSLVVLAICVAIGGSVTAAEKKKEGCDKAGPCPVAAFKKLDKDGDGKLSESEFIAVAKGDKGKERAKAKFKKLDKDENGTLCQKEFAASMKKKGGKKKPKKPCDKKEGEEKK